MLYEALLWKYLLYVEVFYNFNVREFYVKLEEVFICQVGK